MNAINNYGIKNLFCHFLCTSGSSKARKRMLCRLGKCGLGNSCGLDSDGLRPRNKYRPQSKLTIIISRSSRLLVVISLLFFKINNRNAVT